jgi:peptidoglycan/xylan/chitin deacetylase (PgdA/CDA1 family)
VTDPLLDPRSAFRDRGRVLLTFDVEEFDIPLEYGTSLSDDEQIAVGLEGLDRVLELLRVLKVPATLFTTARLAESAPGVLREAARWHEIASHALRHARVEPADLRASRVRLEEIVSRAVHGFRMPRMAPVELSAVRDAGYRYDSSIHPAWMPGRYDHRRLPTRPWVESGVVELPASVIRLSRLPFSWVTFKNLPAPVYRSMAAAHLRRERLLHIYLHPWEFADLRRYRLPRLVAGLCGEPLAERLARLVDVLRTNHAFTTCGDVVERLVGQQATADSVMRGA